MKAKAIAIAIHREERGFTPASRRSAAAAAAVVTALVLGLSTVAGSILAALV
ncbi:MAG: hypothetical protein MEP57_05725 [Microvirga sp.]|nr:hypothetical protein [Microvirga sp.]